MILTEDADISQNGSKIGSPVIQLLLLILRRWRLILVFTLLSMLVSLFVFLQPAKLAAPVVTYTIVDKYIIAQIPSELKHEISFDVLSMARMQALSIPLLEKGIQLYGLKVPADISHDSQNPKFESYIAGDFLAKEYSVSIDSATQILTISLKTQVLTSGIAFLNYVESSVDQALRLLIAERCKIIAEEMGNIIADKRLQDTAYENVLRTLTASKWYSYGNIPILNSIQEEPVIANVDAPKIATNGQAYRKVLLLVFTGFLLGIVLAWIVESIHKLFNDKALVASIKKELMHKKNVQ